MQCDTRTTIDSYLVGVGEPEVDHLEHPPGDPRGALAALGGGRQEGVLGLQVSVGHLYVCNMYVCGVCELIAWYEGAWSPRPEEKNAGMERVCVHVHARAPYLEAVEVVDAVHELVEERAGLQLRQPLLPHDQVEQLAPVERCVLRGRMRRVGLNEKSRMHASFAPAY